MKLFNATKNELISHLDEDTFKKMHNDANLLLDDEGVVVNDYPEGKEGCVYWFELEKQVEGQGPIQIKSVAREIFEGDEVSFQENFPKLEKALSECIEIGYSMKKQIENRLERAQHMLKGILAISRYISKLFQVTTLKGRKYVDKLKVLSDQRDQLFKNISNGSLLHLDHIIDSQKLSSEKLEVTFLLQQAENNIILENLNVYKVSFEKLRAEDDYQIVMRNDFSDLEEAKRRCYQLVDLRKTIHSKFVNESNSESMDSDLQKRVKCIQYIGDIKENDDSFISAIATLNGQIHHLEDMARSYLDKLKKTVKEIRGLNVDSQVDVIDSVSGKLRYISYCQAVPVVHDNCMAETKRRHIFHQKVKELSSTFNEKMMRLSQKENALRKQFVEKQRSLLSREMPKDLIPGIEDLVELPEYKYRIDELLPNKEKLLEIQENGSWMNVSMFLDSVDIKDFTPTKHSETKKTVKQDNASLNLESKCRALEVENNSLKLEMTDLISEKNSLLDELAILRQEIKTAKQNCQSLAEKDSMIQEINARFSKEIQVLKEAIASRDQNIINMSKEAENSSRNLRSAQSRCTELEEQLQNCKVERGQAMEAELNQLRRKLGAVSERSNAYQQEISKKDKEFAVKTHQLENKLQSCQNRCSKLEGSLKVSDSKYKEKCSELTTEKSRFEKDINRMRQKIQKDEEKIHKLTNSIETYTKDLSALHKRVAEQQKDESFVIEELNKFMKKRGFEGGNHIRTLIDFVLSVRNEEVKSLESSTDTALINDLKEKIKKQSSLILSYHEAISVNELQTECKAIKGILDLQNNEYGSAEEALRDVSFRIKCLVDLLSICKETALKSPLHFVHDLATCFEFMHGLGSQCGYLLDATRKHINHD